MKSLKNSVHESLNNINEAATVEAEVMRAYQEYPEDGLEMLDSYADAFDDVKGKDLKKIFKGEDAAKLEDLATVVHQFAGQIRGITDIVRDENEDEPDEDSYGSGMLGIVFNLEDQMDNMVDNLASDGELETVEDGEDIVDMVQQVIDKWNDISKMVIRKAWN